MRLARVRQLPANRAGQEQYEHDRGRDPEGAIKVRVAVEDVKEVGPRVQRRPAPFDDLVGVDVEELGVEVDAPEEAFGGARRPLRGAAVEECGGAVGRDFGAVLRVVEVCRMLEATVEDVSPIELTRRVELKVLLQVGVA